MVGDKGCEGWREQAIRSLLPHFRTTPRWLYNEAEKMEGEMDSLGVIRRRRFHPFDDDDDSWRKSQTSISSV